MTKSDPFIDARTAAHIVRLENEVGNLQLAVSAMTAAIAQLASGVKLTPDVLLNMRDAAVLVMKDIERND